MIRPHLSTQTPTSQIPLQKRLLAIVLLITILGMALSSVAVYALMRGLLYQRADDQLREGLDTWVGQATPWPSMGAPSEFRQAVRYPQLPGYYYYGSYAASQPDFSELEGFHAQTVDSLPGSGGDIEWRAMAIANDDGSIEFVAKSLEAEHRMLASLAIVSAGIGTLTVICIGFAGNFFIRRALAPLREVEQTALAIADGDMERRVPAWSRETEVGKLSYAVNTMVGQLQESVEESRAKEEQMRRFVGDASHELRTPLTSVRGYTELYRTGMVDDPDMVLSKIDEESGRMKLLVEDLLALTRAEGARLDAREVDMFEVVSSVRSTARAAFPGRVLNVNNEALNVPMVKGDPDRLHQVMLNLVSNAFKHGGSDSEVTITLRENLDKVFIDVADTGVGMSPEDAEHIFERFYRADASRNRASGGGSGLGLAITKSIIEAHGGAISVRTAPGEGSTFTLSLPMV
ncbi:sensor histidine kinase [Corynebacterium sanguinis]|uniref:histidine kinase n=1 Tax=Corynebacterium sanguinis TaxID=2594913 RepID=A0A6C1TX02_9CORY|nr:MULTISPECIES: HAMP domain-containing sensor histidine kinase [Corynebacterium]MCT1411496.1 HAMP domain-containing histidine kinase [Corynebacterium sanguinis]MCT1426099.1 HAMP domain-containing histidine kinase [Corynebacterium sanguinis]MCT1445081.1 HAMP domain-containing histidine kinase [Corynebacterium sanguinis]MCT1463031.1 HAMP domain-containing histidine kinase [Corynebacterium sanguinis]MCT1492528.1 HAMP domain-containing histidine kinase [Corynebacterium sanguinis]